MSDQTKEYSHIDNILKYLNRTASPQEIQELLAWMALSKENESCFQEIRNLWEMSDPHLQEMDIDATSALAQVKRKAHISPAERTFHMHAFVQVFQKIAAILILPALIAITMLIFKGNGEKQEIAYQQVTAPYGTVSKITLPDGSAVWLNAGSSLTYPMVFNPDSREVNMAGEAYFEVEANPEYPFKVHTDNLTVTATGTAFNVCSYKDTPQEVITLIKGKVDVTHQKQTEPLLPGQQLCFEHQSKHMKVTDVDTFKYTAWKDGILAFRDDLLIDLFQRLEQIYRVRFDIKDPSLANYTYRATFKGETLNEILEYIKESVPVTFYRIPQETEKEGAEIPVIEVRKN